jgi:hypothetical protein
MRGTIKDFYRAVQLEKTADDYDFPFLVCEDCGKRFDCSDVLRGMAEGLKKGLVEHKEIKE